MLKPHEPVYQAIWVDNMDFDEVLISPAMIQDHMPDTVLAALNKVSWVVGITFYFVIENRIYHKHRKNEKKSFVGVKRSKCFNIFVAIQFCFQFQLSFPFFLSFSQFIVFTVPFDSNGKSV